MIMPITTAMAYERPYDKSAVIVLYHHFGDDDFPQTNIGLDQFDQHIRELQHGGYHVMPVPDIINAMRNGADLPDKTIGITIDGSYLSIYKNAYPRLKKANMPFTLFISPDQISDGSQSFLSWKHIQKMQKSGLMTIGNHGNAGQSVLDASGQELKKSLIASQRLIRDKTGVTPEFFAYPYGEFSHQTSLIIGQLGFKAAFGQQSGPLYIPPQSAEPAFSSDLTDDTHSSSKNTAANSVTAEPDILESFYTLPRFALNENFGELERFQLVASALPLPVQDITPIDNLIDAQNNPPAYGFTIAKPIGGLKNLRCYASSGGKLTLDQFGTALTQAGTQARTQTRFEIRMEKPLSNGRTRVNCTTNGPDGRWRWFGRQFVTQ